MDSSPLPSVFFGHANGGKKQLSASNFVSWHQIRRNASPGFWHACSSSPGGGVSRSCGIWSQCSCAGLSDWLIWDWDTFSRDYGGPQWKRWNETFTLVGIYFIHKVWYWQIVIHVVGLVAIRYGSQTIDPVTGALARVVGARLDTARQTVIPVTVSYWLAVLDQPDSVHVGELRQHLNYWQGTSHKSKHDKTSLFICQVDALQRETCARNTYWQQQRKREDDFLSELDSAVAQSLFSVTESNPYQVLDEWMSAWTTSEPIFTVLQYLCNVPLSFTPFACGLWKLPLLCIFQTFASSLALQWSGRQLRDAALEQQDLARTEAQRRATGRSRLALVLPPPVLRVLMLGKLAGRQDGGALEGRTHNLGETPRSPWSHYHKFNVQRCIMALCAGDEEEWDRQYSWNSALLSSLDKLDVSMEQLQQEQEKWITQGDDWPTLQAAVWIMALLSFIFGEFWSHCRDGYNPPCYRALQ